MAARACALASVKARMAKSPRASAYASIWRLCRGNDAPSTDADRPADEDVLPGSHTRAVTTTPCWARRSCLSTTTPQNNANHIHTVWRDLRLDWGEDLLAGITPHVH
jgi:hypothetical protein